MKTHKTVFITPAPVLLAAQVAARAACRAAVFAATVSQGRPESTVLRLQLLALEDAHAAACQAVWEAEAALHGQTGYERLVMIVDDLEALAS